MLILQSTHYLDVYPHSRETKEYITSLCSYIIKHMFITHVHYISKELILSPLSYKVWALCLKELILSFHPCRTKFGHYVSKELILSFHPCRTKFGHYVSKELIPFTLVIHAINVSASNVPPLATSDLCSREVNNY